MWKPSYRKTRVLYIAIGSMILGAVLFSAGCGGAGRRDRREERHPLLRKAQAAKKVNEIDRAVEIYQRALHQTPSLARAHLELGLLYDQPKEDYIRAIYHYERYLELRPEAEKKEMVRDLIRWAKLSFAASLPDQPSGAVKMIAALKEEVSLLRQSIREMEAQAVPPEQPIAPQESPPATAEQKLERAIPEPAPAEPPVNMYRVQAGDTLSRIAVKMYNDATRWSDIFEANRDELERPESLQVGQTLVIP